MDQISEALTWVHQPLDQKLFEIFLMCSGTTANSIIHFQSYTIYVAAKSGMKRDSPSRTVKGCKKQKTSGETMFLQLKCLDPAVKEDDYHDESGWDLKGLLYQLYKFDHEIQIQS